MKVQETKLQKYSAPALEKGLDIIEYLSLAEGGQSMARLAAGVGRSKNEIFRMVIVLEERGYLRRLDGDVFELTEKLETLAVERSMNGRLAELSRPALAKLSDESGHSCHLSVVGDDELLVVSAMTASQSYGLSVQIGHTMPVFGTSAGASVLSRLSDAELDAALDRLADGASSGARSSFERQVDACRRQGSVDLPSAESRSIRELSAPVTQISVPHALAAITIPYMKTEAIDNHPIRIRERLTAATRLLGEKFLIVLPSLAARGANPFGVSGAHATARMRGRTPLSG